MELDLRPIVWVMLAAMFCLFVLPWYVRGLLSPAIKPVVTGLAEITQAIRDARTETVATRVDKLVRVEFSADTSSGKFSFFAASVNHTVTTMVLGKGLIVTHQFAIHCEDSILSYGGKIVTTRYGDIVVLQLTDTGQVTEFSVSRD